MRRLLSHDKKEVRVAAAEAIGKLAGPAMEHYLKPLVQDPNKEVRAAALTAIARLAQS
jgi:HEAT repeat protein